MSLLRKNKSNKTRVFTTPDGVIITVTKGKPGETLFPKKLAEMNEILSKVKNLPVS